ncbi:MAG: cytochrome c [Proteobacteria bacterium]|nr:cytochrome c [Pseudomonadota bacterium]
MRKSHRSLAGVLIAGLVSTPVLGATSIDAGQALYTANCVGCHGMPPNGLKIDNLVAANRPDLIRRQIQINPAMKFLTALMDADLAEIATFIAYPTTTDADCIFGWGEAILPALLAPRTLSARANGFDYRYYPPANVYVGVAIAATDHQRHLYFLDAKTSDGLLDLGNIGSYLSAALAAGCP